MQRSLSRALYEEMTVEDQTFTDEYAEGLEGRTLECAGCTFERCTFADFRIARYDFAGCTFRGCDLSGLTMNNSRLSRVTLIDCRMWSDDHGRPAAGRVLYELPDGLRRPFRLEIYTRRYDRLRPAPRHTGRREGRRLVDQPL